MRTCIVLLSIDPNECSEVAAHPKCQKRLIIRREACQPGPHFCCPLVLLSILGVAGMALGTALQHRHAIAGSFAGAYEDCKSASAQSGHSVVCGECPDLLADARLAQRVA